MSDDGDENGNDLELPDDFHEQNIKHNDEFQLDLIKRAKLEELYDSFGTDLNDSEKIIILFRKALIDAQEELVINPDSIVIRTRIVKIENYLAKINTILNIENEKVESDMNNNLPEIVITAISNDIIDKLIMSGNLRKDRVTPTKGIDDIVDALWGTQEFENITPEMLSVFRKRNGTPYTEKTLLETIKRTKPDIVKKRRRNSKEAKKK